MARTPEGAKRLARAIVSDIALYNRDKIAQGIENDNVFELLDDEIQRGLEMYENEVGPDVTSITNFFNEALVDVLIKKTGNIKSRIW